MRQIEEVGEIELRNDQTRLILGFHVQQGPGPAQQQAYHGEGQSNCCIQSNSKQLTLRNYIIYTYIRETVLFSETWEEL